MNYTISVSSKNKASLKNFFNFFNKELSSIVSCSMILSQRQKKTSRKIVSVLKSPHVNKTAQVHFSFNRFSKQILVFSHKPNKFFLFMKKVQANLFPDLVVQIKSCLKFKHGSQLNSKFVSPNNFVLDLDRLFSNNQTLNVNKKKIKSVPPIETLIVSKQVKNKSRSSIIVASKIVKYLKIWDCYGEAVLLGFKNKKI